MGEDPKAKVMPWHHERDSTYLKISNSFFWYNMLDDIVEFVKRYKQCQKRRKIQNLISPKLQSVSAPTELTQQVGVCIYNLPESDGYKCINHFSKLSEAKSPNDKLAASVSPFVYEVICRYRCMKIGIMLINDVRCC